MSLSLFVPRCPVVSPLSLTTSIATDSFPSFLPHSFSPPSLALPCSSDRKIAISSSADANKYGRKIGSWQAATEIREGSMGIVRNVKHIHFHSASVEDNIHNIYTKDLENYHNWFMHAHQRWQMSIKLAYYLPTKPRFVFCRSPKNNFPITEDESHSMIIAPGIRERVILLCRRRRRNLT